MCGSVCKRERARTRTLERCVAGWMGWGETGREASRKGWREGVRGRLTERERERERKIGVVGQGVGEKLVWQPLRPLFGA